jgi:hypothetical protein
VRHTSSAPVKGNHVSPRARTLTLPGEKGGKKQQKIRS